ncbi:SET domain-containing protein-lysine N-methyltransferase [Lacinutrix jangbogonensis]|uniref:SET domain-containing protein-lysine N-methyltransferase n=1 Tax=Lacinutrix jangbogonensis TaxID=1469557 RepID=UPI00068C1BFB|nr:SET domain-containing protein-lysine N-methyltransferase [Lacinutrix jangbogonensis]
MKKLTKYNPQVFYIPTNSIEAAEEDYLYIKGSQINNSGNGLYTAINLYKNEIISLFTGEILTEKEAQERAQKKNDRYFINLLDGSIMDSMHTECFAKYANDSINSNFDNNAKITLDDDNNVCLKATKKIKSGEEIFCGYGKRYWNKHK